MKLRLISGWLPHWLPLLGALIVIGIAFDLVTRSRLSATTGMICEGEYSDTLQVQSVRTRDLEQGARGQYSYLIRSTAKYECPFFGPDGKLRRRRVQASELGTAFAYEVSGGETYLLTNEHVAVWPEVTDSLHRIEGVADGCKRVEDKLRIVRDERDDFDPGQIALTRVAVDPLLDAAILKAGQRLTVLPYKIGKSAGLRQGNAVALTTTLNSMFGCGVMVRGSGFLLNNEMDDFSAKPGVPNMFGLVGGAANAVAPGKRMLSSMTPTILVKDGKTRLVAGSPGGSRIITTVLQVVLNIVDFKMTVQQAVDAPRFHHQWLPDRVTYERGALSPDTVALLRARGHTLVEGNVQVHTCGEE